MNNIKIYKIILSFLLYSQNICLAGQACFNYEVQEHQNLAQPVFNQALLHYTYPLIAARNGIIPALDGAGNHTIQISQLRPLGEWQHNLTNLGIGLTLQEGCQIALDREDIGIIVNFEHPNVINLVAAGNNPAAIAILTGVNVANYLPRALNNGGYLNPLAAVIYRIRTNLPQVNFIGNPVQVVDAVILHIHLPRRVSKNMKELSFNSILNPGAPGNVYMSIKNIINQQFTIQLLPVPHSGTVVSFDTIQLQ